MAFRLSWDITNQKYLGWKEMVIFATKVGVKLVPLVDENFVLDEFHTHVPNLLAMADGTSALNREARREGLVMRPVIEQQIETKGGSMRFSFKVISNQYLLDEI